jgi:AcrR family transcriptional regulator
MTRNERPRDDLRVRRTRKLILDALLELTIQKGFAAVTVHDLTQLAGINRATFYRHYRDKFDLLDQYSQAVYELLDLPPEADAPAGSTQEADQAPRGLVRMLDHIAANARFYRVMLGRNGDPAFAEKVRQYVERRMRRSLTESLARDPAAVDFFLSFISSGSVGAVVWWLEHDLPYSSEEMAAISIYHSAAIIEAMLHQPMPRLATQGPP